MIRTKGIASAAMTKTLNILAGWAVVAGALTLALAGLPRLADASSQFKDQAHWQSQAEIFAQSQTSEAKISQYARNSAALLLPAQPVNVWQADRIRLGKVEGPSLIRRAKYVAGQRKCLAEAIYYEARSERMAGQRAVAEVILNRVNHSAFPDTICGVVYQGAERTTGCQFSFSCDGSMAKLPSGGAWERSQAVADHMIMKASVPTTRRATHYHTTAVSPVWAPSLRQTRQFDTHIFYRFMPRRNPLRSVIAAP